MLPAAFAAGQAPADSALSALATERQGLWHMAAPVFDNAAINQWRMGQGLTAVGASYAVRKDSEAVVPQDGDGAHHWKAGASTYTKYRNSTLSGSAFYTNGKRRNVRWCETSSPELVYPYIMADSVGGDFNSESYEFSGAYSDHRGRLSWGATLSYKATLEYRPVDPRPRNVSGCLDASVAIGYNAFADYQVAADIDLRRYTQSNDIEFKSEMGVDKIFHLSGPLSHYARFGGTGLSTSYRGYRYGGGLALYPSSGRGGFLRAHASSFSFDNILSDLNKLPMAEATERSLEIAAGWLHPSRHGLFWAVNAAFATARRHGSENIFGDATAGMYPQIASIEMFARNASSLSASLLGGLHAGASRLSVRLTPAYSYSSWLYLSPRSLGRVKAMEPRAAVQWHLAGRRWLFSASATACLRFPLSSLYSPAAIDSELRQLGEIALHSFLIESSRQQHYSLRAGIARMLSRRMGLSLEAVASRSNYRDAIHSNSFDINLSLIF